MIPNHKRAACCLLAILCMPAVAQTQSHQSGFTPFGNSFQALLEGNWQSCKEPDGYYGERVYDYTAREPKFELHMGPNHEFAIFQGIQEEHRGHDWSGNLLNTAKKPLNYSVSRDLTKQTWQIPKLNVILTVTWAGGSYTDCESWFVLLTPLSTTDSR